MLPEGPERFPNGLSTCFACRKSWFDPQYHMVPGYFQERPPSTGTRKTPPTTIGCAGFREAKEKAQSTVCWLIMEVLCPHYHIVVPSKSDLALENPSTAAVHH